MRSKPYRAGMAEANAGNRIAFQIRLMREGAGMSQAELAAKLGTRQSAVARLEDPDYGKQSLAVLHRIASIFDVSAWVEFVSFSTLLQRTAELTPEALTPKRYDAEFDEDGQPNTSVQLVCDGSAICLKNYSTPVANAGSLVSPGLQISNIHTFNLSFAKKS